MADTKLTDLTLATPVGTDVFYIVDDPGGSPLSRKATIVSIPVTEAQISDLGAYITDVTGDNLSALADVTITSIASGEVLKWNGSAWINNTLAEAGIAATSHTHTESDITDLQSYLLSSSIDTSAKIAAIVTDETGSGALVFATSPTLVTPALGTPSSGVLTNCTGTAAGLTAGNVTTNANLTGHVTSVGNAAVLGSFTTAQLNTAISDGTINTPEGTAVKSTGEAGGTKFLREDGDGTCSWQTPSGSGDFLADGSVPMTGDIDLDGNNIDNGGVIFLKEQADADADVAGSLQIWVNTATPNELWYTDDAGTDFQVASIGGTETLTNKTLTSPTLTTPALGTPASGVLTNCTGLPESGLADNAVTLAKMAGGTDGNLITFDTSGDPAYVATGTSGQVLTSNGAGAAPTFQAAAGGSAELPLKYIAGLTLSNDTDTDHDINVTAGEARDGADGEDMALSSSLTKQIDAAWAVGTNAGGLDFGTVANSTWYHVWLIKRTDTGVVDVLFSASATVPTMPTNYDTKRRIGAVLTDSSANIVQFTQLGDEFIWDTVARDFSDNNPGTSVVTKTLTVPTGVEVFACLVFALRDTSPSSDTHCLVTTTDQVDTTPAGTARTMVVASGTEDSAAPLCLKTNTSAQIRYRLSQSTTDHFVQGTPYGWIDPRGRW